ncbi:alpha-(1,3)-fucosyltransferase fut-6-like [Argopecten irradians]|uniref:alpha-(1,3)-fucosyltransferase fut-6-like n=1 Tax=Argopecten irradians TaxID=31199 RepID=UPI0037189F41
MIIRRRRCFRLMASWTIIGISALIVFQFTTSLTKLIEKLAIKASHNLRGHTTTFTYAFDINTTSKNIYFYNPEFFHPVEDWVFDTWGTEKKLEGCPVSQCIFTRGKVRMDKIDAIIFKPRNMVSCPPSKPPGQVWIFAEFESPNNYFEKKCFYDLKNKVNWTMTYRRDADFTLEHGYFRKSNKPKYSDKELDDIFAKKNRTAVVFISNCRTYSKRLAFVKLLQSYGVQVDIFGSCGTRLPSCDDDLRYRACFNISGSLKPDCFSEVLPRYKFFLSLENSLCFDYTTEKSLHRIMQHPIIPVIRDGSNASLFHPPHSYLKTDDYKSVKDLARHMEILANNKTAYLEYFKWKQFYYTEDMYKEWKSAFCQICERLNNPGSYKRIYGDIAAWHMSPRGKFACHNATDLDT